MFRFSTLLSRRPNFIKLTTAIAELTVVVGLVLPIANDHVKRGHRANARAALSNAAQWMERTASAQGRYPKAVAIPESVLFVKGMRYTISNPFREFGQSCRQQPSAWRAQVRGRGGHSARRA